MLPSSAVEASRLPLAFRRDQAFSCRRDSHVCASASAMATLEEPDEQTAQRPAPDLRGLLQELGDPGGLVKGAHATTTACASTALVAPIVTTGASEGLTMQRTKHGPSPDDDGLCDEPSPTAAAAAAAAAAADLLASPAEPSPPLRAAPVDEPSALPPVVKTCPSPHFRNDFFAVARSETAGWGAFAARMLRRGDVILRERPLMVADRASLFSEFEKLDPAAGQLALSLHANQLSKPGTPLIQAVWTTNCFTVGGRKAGLFPVAARFNHACCPSHNVEFRFDADSGCLELSIRADQVEAGDELRISYGKYLTAAELYMIYGFRCRCGACRGLSDRDIWNLTSRW